MPIVDPFETKIVDPFEEQPEEPSDNLPSLTQGEPMTAWESVKSLFKDPEEEGARAVQALVDSEALKIAPSAAYRYRDAIDRGEKINPQAAALRSTMTDRVKQSWDTGLKQRQVGLLGSDFVLNGDIKAMEEMQKIKFPSEAETFISEGRLESAVRSAAKMLPIMVETSKESVAKGLTVGMGFGGIAALLGQAGPQVALPEEIATVPAATALGFKIGATQGAFESALKMEAGLAVSELLQFQDAEGNQLSPDIARATAFGIGTINAAIELSQLRTLMKTVPGLDKLLSRAMAETVTSKAVKDQLFSLARRYAGTVASETGQEVAQESVNIVFEEMAKSLSRVLEGTDIPAADAAQIVDRLKETAIESAQGFAVMALPGTVAGVAGVRAEKATEATQPPTGATEETQPAPEGLSPEEVAQALATGPPVDEADVEAIFTATDEDLDAVIDSILSRGEGGRFETFKSQVSEIVEPEQAHAVSAIMEARAKAVGMTPDEYIEYHNLEVRTAPETVDSDGIQYNQEGRIVTETPEFKNWFGESKVVDESGAPLVVYHGTNQPVSSFAEERLGESTKTPAAGVGFFFTASTEEAGQYADYSAERQIANAVNHEKEMTRLIKEQEKAERRGDWDRVDELTVEIENLDLGAIRAEPQGGNVIPVHLSLRNPLIVEVGGKPYSQGEILDRVTEAKEGGHDGLILRGIQDAPTEEQISGGTVQYIAFDPTQIKSIFNRGTFDPNNPNILEQRWTATFDPAQVAQVDLPESTAQELPSKAENGQYFRANAETLQGYLDRHGDGFLYRVADARGIDRGFDRGLPGYKHQFKGTSAKVHSFTSSLEDAKRVLENAPEGRYIVYRVLPADLGEDFAVQIPSERQGESIHVQSPLPASIQSVDVLYRNGQWEERDAADARRDLEARRGSQPSQAGVGGGVQGLRADVGREGATTLEQPTQRGDKITKASVVFNDTQTIINAFESADISSLVHELGHVFRRDLGGEDLATAEEWAGVKDGVWTVPAEEKFARGFERYLAEGKAPTAELQDVFAKLKDWLLEIYWRITGSDIDVNISPEIRGVFDRLLSEEGRPAPDTLSQTATLEQAGPKEAVKTRIRRLTGQAKDTTKTVSEREALKAAMKKAVQAARVAEREGKTEGVTMERARLKALLSKATEKRKAGETVRSLKAKIKKELKTTVVKKQSGKPVGKFTPEIQQTLDTLRKVSKLSPEEAEARIAENLAKFENELPLAEVVIENHLLELVARLDSMNDPEALKALLEDIRALKAEGRELRSIKAMERARVNREAVENTVAELGGLPEGLESVGIKEFTPRSRFESAKKFMHTLGKTIIGWDDVMDILSFKSGEKTGESFISKNNNLLGIKNAEKKGSRVSLQEVHDIYRDAYGLQSIRQMAKKIQQDNTEEMLLRQLPFVDNEGRPVPRDLKFTRSELRKRAMELMDPSLWPTFEKMGYTEQVAAEIFERMSVQDEMFIQAQMDFYRKYYDGVNDTYKEMYGVNLPKNEFYSPVKREGISAPEDGGLGEFMREMSFRSSAATSGSLKSRVGSVKTLGKQSDLAVLQRHIVEMEHFKAWGEKIRDLNAVWKHPDVRAAVQINHGRGMIALVDNFISDLAANGSNLAHKLEGLDKFRINFTKAALAIRPSITIKQLTSFVAYADAMPVSSFLKYHLKFWAHPVQNSKEILENSELMKERGGNIDRDLKAAMGSEEYSAFSKHQSFTNALLLNVKMGDQGAILMGGWPYYQWLIDEKGYTKAQAIEAFEKFTEQTQQSADITEQSYWQRGGTLAKLTTMFMSSPNQYLRKEIAAIRNSPLGAGRQGWGKTVKTLLIYHAVLPMFFQLVSDRFTWDEDEQKRALIFGPLNGLFIMGDALDFLLRKALGMRAFDMELPVFSAAHDLVKGSDLLNLFDLTEEEFFKAIRGMAGFVGDVTGIPFKTVVDTSKAATDIFDGEYEKGLSELMGYSPYKSEQLAND